MILTCPTCGTQYVVKDGAIPPQGRQVRCASCKHSWHQDPEPAAEAPPEKETIAEAALIDPSSGPEAEERAFEEAALADEAAQETVEPAREPGPEDMPAAMDAPAVETAPPAYAPLEDDAARTAEETLTAEPAAPQDADDDFSPFAYEENEAPKRRGPLLSLLVLLLLITALAAAFWFLAPAPWKERLGIASATDTPLQLMMTHSDRQKLASGNELLAVSGRVINPTEESQQVPPIQAQLRSSSGQLVYSWTISPPARTLPPGASATFNSAEVNVPAGGDQLTISLGAPKA